MEVMRTVQVAHVLAVAVARAADTAVRAEGVRAPPTTAVGGRPPKVTVRGTVGRGEVLAVGEAGPMAE
jgi:hypothetical protein